MNRDEILETAQNMITGDRHRDYGDARANFTRIAKMWECVLGVPITPEQFTQCMILVKLDRLTHTRTHEDSWVDICGYAALGGEIATEISGGGR